jgi:ATP-dependent helicase/nuclease subunit A
VLDRLDAEQSVAEAEDEPVELERGDARFVLRVERTPMPEVAASVAAPVEVGAQLPLFTDLPLAAPRLGVELPALEPAPPPPVHDVRRLSYSALALFERCSYRYFAERVLGLPPVPSRRLDEATEAPAEAPPPGLAGTEIGDAVHRLLELIPLSAPAAPSRAELSGTVRSWYPAATDVEIDRIAALVDAYCASGLAQRLAGLTGALPERPFAFEHDGVLLHGRLDVLWREGERALVVDYKSNALDGADPHEIVENEYRVQRLVYALACLRDGAAEVEVAYQFLERPDEVVSATFATSDTSLLEAELSEAISRIRAGEFRPTPSEFACSDCPALDLVCAGPRLHLEALAR